MQYAIYEDNGGRFHWRLDGDDGERLAESAQAFDSRREAQAAAAVVHAGAATANGADG